MPARERTLWTGRPSVRLLVLNPAYLAALAGVAWLLRLWLLGLPLPVRVTIPGGYDPRLLAALVLGVPLLWWPLACVATRFRLTTERLTVSSGVLARTIDEVELYRVRDVRLNKGVFQRLVGLGTVTVGSSDGTGTLVMTSIGDSTRVREAVREAAEAAKVARGLSVIA